MTESLLQHFWSIYFPTFQVSLRTVLSYLFKIGFKYGRLTLLERNNFTGPWYKTNYLVSDIVPCTLTVHSSRGVSLKLEYFTEILRTRQMIMTAWLISKKSKIYTPSGVYSCSFHKTTDLHNITLPLTLALACIFTKKDSISDVSLQICETCLKRSFFKEHFETATSAHPTHTNQKLPKTTTKFV